MFMHLNEKVDLRHVPSEKCKSSVRIRAECDMCWFYQEPSDTIGGLVQLIYNRQIFMPYVLYCFAAKTKMYIKSHILVLLKWKS